ncbi:MAG: YbaK/EbsC family protein [Nitriliruptoraceae bacterium]|nr:YbaK/EbsC family protein [Nitriliruptoraceae bacterium]
MASDAVERFTARAAALGIDVAPRRFPEGTRTARDAAAAIGCDVAQIVKSLVFVGDDGPILALTSGANRVDERKLAAALEVATVRKADADEVRGATGYAIGGTPPFGHTATLAVVCDQDLLGFEEIWAAAGTPSDVFPLTPATLLAASEAAVADIAQR